MATSPKKNNRILDRDLAKALTDLSKVIPQKELAKKFRIKKWHISVYKEHRRRKPFDKRKRKKILQFYSKLQEVEREEDFLYHYRVVTKKKRLIPSIKLPTSKVVELVERIGVVKLAREIGVKPETVERWQKGRFLKLKLKTKERLYEIHRKYLKRWVGLFFVKEIFIPKHRKRGKSYCKIVYYKIFYGTESEFVDYVRDREYFKVEGWLIDRKRKFKGTEVQDFLEYLDEVVETKDEVLLRKSIEDCREFLTDNFKGRILSRLLKIVRIYEKVLHE